MRVPALLIGVILLVAGGLIVGGVIEWTSTAKVALRIEVQPSK